MRKNEKAVTLVELMITVAVILLALVPLLQLFINANRGNQHLAQVTVADNLIQQTFDEISRRKWDENSPAPGVYTLTRSAILGVDGGSEMANDKTTFNDMDDYATIDDIPRDLSGNIIPGYEAYRISVAVVYITNPSDPSVPAVVTAPPWSDFKMVTVSVTWKGGGSSASTVKSKSRIFYNGVNYNM